MNCASSLVELEPEADELLGAAPFFVAILVL
jgi:hypothetical protein